MSAPAFTPGPWQRKSGYEPTIIIGNVDGEIHPDGATSYSHDFIANLEDEYGGSPANAYANAALILAAPELYGAAKTVLDGLNARIDAACEAGENAPVFAGIAALSDALNKARGEA